MGLRVHPHSKWLVSEAPIEITELLKASALQEDPEATTGQDSSPIPSKSWASSTPVGACLWALTQALPQSSGRHKRVTHLCKGSHPHSLTTPRSYLHGPRTSQHQPHTRRPTECWVICLKIWRSTHRTTAYFSR